MNRKKRIQHEAEYSVLRTVMLMAWMLSDRSVSIAGRWIGWFAFSLLGFRRRVVLRNLEIAFPDLSEAERHRIARRTYQQYAVSFLEFMRFPILDREEYFSRVDYEGWEHVASVMERGSGAIFLGGHFGNWEVIAAAMARRGCPVHVVIQEQHNPKIEAVKARHSAMMGMRFIRKSKEVLSLYRVLRRGGFVAMLADQDARDEGVFVDFFGRPSSTHQGPAVLALKMGLPLVFGSTIRQPGGRYRLVFESIPLDHLNGFSEENVRVVTQTFCRFLEKRIREHPDHYYWFHRRWKSSPEGGPAYPYS